VLQKWGIFYFESNIAHFQANCFGFTNLSFNATSR